MAALSLDYFFLLQRTLKRSLNSFDVITLYFPLMLVSYFIYCAFIRPQLSPLRKVPGQRCCIPVINVIYFLKHLFGELKDIPADQPLTRHFFGLGEAVIIKGVDEAKHVIASSKKYKRTDGEKMFFGRIVGRGLLSVSGDEHTEMRKMLNLSFTGSSVNGMTPIFYEYAQKLVDVWKRKLLQGKPRDFADICIQDDFMKLTLDVICQAGFGYNLNALNNEHADLAEAFTLALDIGGRRSATSLIPILKIIPSSGRRKYLRSVKLVRDFVTELVIEKEKESEKGWENEPHNLLELMLKNSGRYGLKTDDLVDHVRTFMLAGHETTGASLIWTLYCLASNPDVQTTAREEISSVLSETEPITTKAVESMPYLNGVVKESLRLHVPVPGVTKTCVQEDTLGGVRIPVGTKMGISIVGLHKNPKIWPNPEKFDPTRFIPPNCNNHSPWQFLPFSSGKHMCIGYRMSLMESKVTVAALLRDLEFSLVPGYTFQKSTSLSTKADPPMMLRVRKL